jgi:outer membrane protein assembly factor BamB
VGNTLLVWAFRRTLDGRRHLEPYRVESYAPADGKPLWSTPVRPALERPRAPWTYSIGATQRFFATWARGDVLRGLRLEGGTDAWTLPLCRGVASTGKLLVTTSENRLLFLNPGTGRTERRVKLRAAPASAPTMVGDRIVLLGKDRSLIALDPRTGRLAWRRSLVQSDGRRPQQPRAAGTLLLVPYLLPKGSPAGAVLEARHAGSGATIWQKRFTWAQRRAVPHPFHFIVAAEDLLLLPNRRDRCLEVLRLDTGTRLFVTCGLDLSSPPLILDGRIFVLGREAEPPGRSRRAPRSEDRPVLVISTRTGRVSQLQVAPKWRRGRARPLRAVRLQLGPIRDGVLYLAQKNRYLAALRIKEP